ncbi:MAG: hypothetical protein KatS3mg117_1072 [Geminicoccaceae bacterium]|jgi:phage shock protein A|nr:MAG: hypothetical protein KatS3mg117_1072 [Geminicoccaceae bacterium]
MTVSLEFIATQLQRVLEELRQIREQLDRMGNRLEKAESRDVELGDEMTVLTGMVLRYSSEHIAWGGVQRQLKRLEERIARLEGAQPTSP